MSSKPCSPRSRLLRSTISSLRQRKWLARQQFLDLFKMVLVDVVIAERVNKLADFQPANVRDHVH